MLVILCVDVFRSQLLCLNVFILGTAVAPNQAMAAMPGVRPVASTPMAQRPIVGAHGNMASSAGATVTSASTNMSRNQPFNQVNLPMGPARMPPSGVPGVSAAAAANAAAANALLMQRIVHPRGMYTFFALILLLLASLRLYTWVLCDFDNGFRKGFKTSSLVVRLDCTQCSGNDQWFRA